jgi:hypothetical protein
VRLRRGNGDVEFLERREDIFDAERIAELALAEHDRIEVSCWKPLLRQIDVLDTPGFNAQEQDDRAALLGVDEADLLVVIVGAKELSQPELRLLDEIHRRRKRYAVLVNCLEKTGPAAGPSDDQVSDICAAVSSRLESKGQRPIAIGGEHAIWPCNLLWAWHALGHLRREADSSCEREEALQKLRWIEQHFRINHEGPVPRPSALLARSQFLPIREMLESYPWRSLQAGLNESEIILQRAVDLWDSELRHALSVSR